MLSCRRPLRVRHARIEESRKRTRHRPCRACSRLPGRDETQLGPTASSSLLARFLPAGRGKQHFRRLLGVPRHLPSSNGDYDEGSTSCQPCPQHWRNTWEREHRAQHGPGVKIGNVRTRLPFRCFAASVAPRTISKEVGSLACAPHSLIPGRLRCRAMCRWPSSCRRSPLLRHDMHPSRQDTRLLLAPACLAEATGPRHRLSSAGNSRACRGRAVGALTTAGTADRFAAG